MYGDIHLTFPNRIYAPNTVIQLSRTHIKLQLTLYRIDQKVRHKRFRGPHLQDTTQLQLSIRGNWTRLASACRQKVCVNDIHTLLVSCLPQKQLVTVARDRQTDRQTTETIHRLMTTSQRRHTVMISVLNSAIQITSTSTITVKQNRRN